ncbi:response regulator [Alteromonas sp. McT4-15]|uniref:response regulator n=1 Tax=Alteromonas sp. McT4-15 TaxID=2881256 RepID=UPI001CF8F0AC|nr:response regulator [Alteromonas sp. McT4-15]MCB4436055.1 response regulator [Alteromonas sp. McT4-15]
MRNHSISTPIIAFTAAVVKDELEKALAAGMNDYLTKPIDKDALHVILAKYLNSKTFSTNTDVEKAFNTA